MRAAAGDRIHFEGKVVGMHEHTAVVVETRGEDGGRADCQHRQARFGSHPDAIERIEAASAGLDAYLDPRDVAVVGIVHLRGDPADGREPALGADPYD